MINVNSDHKRGIDKSTVFPTGRAGKATTLPIASKNIAGEGLGKEVNGNPEVTNNVLERVRVLELFMPFTPLSCCRGYGVIQVVVSSSGVIIELIRKQVRYY